MEVPACLPGRREALAGVRARRAGENPRHSSDPICSTFTLCSDFVNQTQPAI